MHIAQANIALFRKPLDKTDMEGFVAQIQPLNRTGREREWLYLAIHGNLFAESKLGRLGTIRCYFSICPSGPITHSLDAYVTSPGSPAA